MDEADVRNAAQSALKSIESHVTHGQRDRHRIPRTLTRLDPARRRDSASRSRFGLMGVINMAHGE